jgi:hypothetical protein
VSLLHGVLAAHRAAMVASLSGGLELRSGSAGGESAGPGVTRPPVAAAAAATTFAPSASAYSRLNAVDLAAGFTSGCAIVMVGHPFETVRTRMQTCATRSLLPPAAPPSTAAGPGVSAYAARYLFSAGCRAMPGVAKPPPSHFRLRRTGGKVPGAMLRRSAPNLRAVTSQMVQDLVRAKHHRRRLLLLRMSLITSECLSARCPCSPHPNCT